MKCDLSIKVLVMNIEVKEEFAIAMIMTSSEIRNTW
jgi:hypothetical protein